MRVDIGMRSFVNTDVAKSRAKKKKSSSSEQTFSTHPVKLAGLPGSLELDRPTFRACINLIKANRQVRIINSDSGIPAFIYHISDTPKPFAMAVYKEKQQPRYFLLLNRIPLGLRQAIERAKKGDTHVQDKSHPHVRTASRSKSDSRKGIRS